MVQVEVLPDIDLVQRVKDNACSDSFNELSKRHSNLFYKVCQTYAKTIISLGISVTDIFEEKDIVIFEAIRRYNPNKQALFSTWLGNYTRYFCLNKINAAKNMPEVSSEEEIAAVFDHVAIDSYHNQSPNVNLDGIFKVLDSCNDQRVKNIFRLRYDPTRLKKRTWASIANQLKLTVQTTIQLHKKGLKLLRDEIAQEKLEVFQDF